MLSPKYRRGAAGRATELPRELKPGQQRNLTGSAARQAPSSRAFAAELQRSDPPQVGISLPSAAMSPALGFNHALRAAHPIRAKLGAFDHMSDEG